MPLVWGVVGLGPVEVDVLHRQVELVGVIPRLPVVLGPLVGEDELQLYPLLIREGDHPVIESVGASDGALVGVEFSDGHPAVGVDDCLLVDPAHSLDSADVVGVLGSQVTGMLLLDLPVGLLLLLGFLLCR